MKYWVNFFTSFLIFFSTAFGLEDNDSDIHARKITKYLKEAAKDITLNSNNDNVLKHYKSEENLSVANPKTSKAIPKEKSINSHLNSSSKENKNVDLTKITSKNAASLPSGINNPIHLMSLNNRDKVLEMTRSNNQGIQINKLSISNTTFKANDASVVHRDSKEEIEAATTELHNKNSPTNELNETYYKAKINSNNIVNDSKNQNKDIKNVLMSTPVSTANDNITHGDEIKENFLRRNMNTEFERNTNAIAAKVQAIPKIFIDEDHINQEITDQYHTKYGIDDSHDNIVIEDRNCEEFIERTNAPPQILSNRKNVVQLNRNTPQKFNGYYSIPFYGSYNMPHKNIGNTYDIRNLYKPGYMYINPSQYPNENEMNLNKENDKTVTRISKMKAIQTPVKTFAYNEIIKSNSQRNRIWRTWKNTEIRIIKAIADKIKQGNKLYKKPISVPFYNKPPFVACNMFYRNQMRPKSVCPYNFYPNYQS